MECLRGFQWFGSEGEELCLNFISFDFCFLNRCFGSEFNYFIFIENLLLVY